MIRVRVSEHDFYGGWVSYLWQGAWGSVSAQMIRVRVSERDFYGGWVSYLWQGAWGSVSAQMIRVNIILLAVASFPS